MGGSVLIPFVMHLAGISQKSYEYNWGGVWKITKSTCTAYPGKSFLSDMFIEYLVPSMQAQSGTNIKFLEAFLFQIRLGLIFIANPDARRQLLSVEMVRNWSTYTKLMNEGRVTTIAN